MLNYPSRSPNSDQMFKNEHSTFNKEQSIPDRALLLDILKTMELQFQKRGFLPFSSSETFNPVWFVATCECNNFLWRRGLSLNQKSEFEFWINTEQLVEKRKHQLILIKEGFSFSAPTWGLALPTEYNVQRELDYLHTFLEVTEKIQCHVQALSKAGLQLEKELTPEGKTKKTVILPV